MAIFQKDKTLYKTLATLAIPLVLQNLITYSVGLADSVMVGALGDLALSGVHLSSQVQNILQMLTLGISAAMVVLAAQYVGKKDLPNARAIVSITLKLAVGIALLCTVVVFLFPSPILRLFTADDAVIAEGIRYIRVVCFSYVFFCANSVFLSALRCVGNTKPGFVASAAGFVVNVFLNWVLIFGKLGAPALGVQGAAIATLIARFVEMAISFCWLRFADKDLLYRFKDLLHSNLLLVKDFMRYGLPVVTGDVLWGIAGAVQVAILGRLGAEVIAANTIADSLYQVVSVVVFSVAGATGIIIGQDVGAGLYDKVKGYTKSLEVIFLIIGVATGLFFFIIREPILDLAFTGISPAARQYAIQFTTVLSVTVVGTAYEAAVLTGIVRSGGATNFVLINDIIFVWVVVVPSALLAAFVFHFPPVVVFACLKCDQVLKCVVAFFKVRRFDWMKKLTRETV